MSDQNSAVVKEVKEIKRLVKFPMGHSWCNINSKPTNGDNSKTDFYDYSLFAIISKSSEWWGWVDVATHINLQFMQRKFSLKLLP